MFDIMCLSEGVSNHWVSVNLSGTPRLSETSTPPTSLTVGPAQQQSQFAPTTANHKENFILKFQYRSRDVKVLRVSFHAGHLPTIF